jgi:hypothetical protein
MHFNWVQSPSAWQYAQSWRQRRSAMVQGFLNDGATVASAFATAQTNYTTGLATLAAQASIARTQAQIKAAKQQFSTTQSQVNLLA